MVRTFVSGRAGVSTLARQHRVALRVLDIGVDDDLTGVDPAVQEFKIRRSSGAMGIGNTTPAAALIAASLGIPASEVTGRGTGVDDAAFVHKQELIQQALDGVISVACALIADRLAPGAVDWFAAGHRSPEPGQSFALDKLGLSPILDLGMRLGEGSGAVAVGTLTALPTPPPHHIDRSVAGRAMVIAPLAVLPLGLLVAFVCWAGRELELEPLAIGALVLGSCALHLDGLADTADGLTVSYDRERSLAVMKSGITGPADVVILIVVLVIQIASIANILSRPYGPQRPRRARAARAASRIRRSRAWPLSRTALRRSVDAARRSCPRQQDGPGRAIARRRSARRCSPPPRPGQSTASQRRMRRSRPCQQSPSICIKIVENSIGNGRIGSRP